MNNIEATESVIDMIKRIQAIGKESQEFEGAEGSRNYAMALTYCLGNHIAKAFNGNEAQKEKIFSLLREISEGP